MGEAELRTFEAFCDTLYTSPNAEERNKAEAALVQLSTTPEYIPRCQFVLSNSQMPYAQLVASNALKKLLQTSWNHLTPPQRVEYRNYALNFLANQGPGLQGFVAASLVQLVACVTKLGWMEIEDHTQVLHEVGRFLQATPGHLVLGIQVHTQRAPARRHTQLHTQLTSSYSFSHMTPSTISCPWRTYRSCIRW